MNKHEVDYYEYDKFWNSQKSDNDKNRINFIIKNIPNDADSLLDVGCGNGIFINEAIQNMKLRRIVGLDRCKTAMKYVKTDKIIGSIDTLPFHNNGFNLVTALEVLEHLPLMVYEKALNEICRIARKYIIISVPNNENLSKSLVQCPSCQTRFSSCYHMRSFNKENLRTLFLTNGFKLKALNEIGKTNHRLFINEFIGFVNKIKRINNFDGKTICPLCGYTRRESHYSNEEMQNSLKQNTPKSMLVAQLKNLLNRGLTKERYIWLFAIYESF
jgi:ubiquinone/menaquinone biosynthesis C-methylase UbiE